MAAHHVVRAAALYLEKYPNTSACAIKQVLIDSSTKNRLTEVGSGSPNRLLYTGFIKPEPYEFPWLIPVINNILFN